MRSRIYAAFCSLLLLTACQDWRGTRADRAEEAYLKQLDSLHKSSFNLPPEEQAPLFEKMLRLGREEGYRRLQANALLELAVVKNLAGQYDSSLTLSREALQILGSDTANLLNARLHNEMGIAYDYKAQYRKSLDHYKLSGEYFEMMGDRRGLIHIQNNIALIYQNLGDLAKAEAMLRTAMKLQQRDRKLIEERAMLVSNLAAVLEKKGQYAQALPYFRETLVADIESGVKSYVVSSYHNLGELFVHLKMSDSARYYLDTALALKRSLKAEGSMVNTHLAYAQLLLQDSLAREADSVWQLASTMARQTGATQQLQEAFSLRKSILAAQGDYSGALRYADSAYQLKDSLGNARYNAELNGIEKDAAIAKASQDLAQQRQINRQQLVGTVALGVLVLLTLGASGWIYLLYRRKTKLMKDLHHRQMQVEDLLERRTRFLGFLAHEIRNPLSGIVGLNNLMLDDGGLPPLARQYIGYIKDAGTQLLNLLNNLLDYQKVSSQQLHLNEVPVQLKEVMRQVQSLYQAQMTQKEIAFRLVYDPLVPEAVMGDPVRLSQVFSNLLHNAVKFSPTGGRVELIVQVADLSTTEVALVCSVVDQGPGIDKAEFNIIFEEYSQGSQGNYRADSSGLGLSLSQQILKLMGTHLELESKPGSGSRFSFRLVLKKESRSATTQTGLEKITD